MYCMVDSHKKGVKMSKKIEEIDNLDYVKIGQRIRKFRKASGLSQEELAWQVGISPAHLSHIETANTKLSLSVFVKIAKALSVHTDELLYDSNEINGTNLRKETLDIIESCTSAEMFIIHDILKATAETLHRHI